MRAQVSLIAIVGVIIVLAGIGLFFVLDMRDPSLPSGFADVEGALEQCLFTETEALIPLAAFHGGEPAYVEPLPPGTPRTVADEKGRSVPVWVSFDADCTGSCMHYWRPKLHADDIDGGGLDLSIEQQFEYELSSRVVSCFEDAAAELDVSADVRDVSARVVIGERVRSDVTIDGAFSRDGRTASRLSASSSHESSFSDLFAIAQAVSSLEAEYGVLGAYIRDVISLDSGVDRPYPPIYAYDFSYAPRIWTAPGVSETLASDLERYAPLIQFSTSDSPDEPGDLPYVLRRGLIDLERSGSPVGDDAFVSIRPVRDPSVHLNDGSIVSGEAIDSVLPLIGNLIPIRQYRTSYDVEAPQIVSLTSRTDGLVFRFALEPRIENNRVMRSGVSGVSGSSDALSLAARAYCDDPAGAEARLSVSGADPEDVSVRYTCGARSCTYAFDESLTLPACIGGELSAFGPGVRFASQRVDSAPSGTVSFSLDARAERSMDLDLRIVETRPVLSGGEPSSLESVGSRSIRDDELAIITFESLEFDHSAVAIVQNGAVTMPPLYESAYDVSIQVMRELDDPVVIPEEEICAGIDTGIPGIGCAGTPQTIDEIVFEDSLLLATYDDIGPVFVDSDATIDLDVPVFDLERISEDNRKAVHVGFYDLLDESFDLGGVDVS